MTVTEDEGEPPLTWGKLVFYAIALEATYNYSTEQRVSVGWSQHTKEEYMFHMAMVGIGRLWSTIQELAMQERVGKMIEFMRTPVVDNGGKPN